MADLSENCDVHFNSIVADSTRSQDVSGKSLNAAARSRIPLGLLSLASDVSSPPPTNGLVHTKRHRPVVRSQSSRVSLLRQFSQPASASSFTSSESADCQHFALPDKFVEYRHAPGRRIFLWSLLTLSSAAIIVVGLWLIQYYGLLSLTRTADGYQGRRVCTTPACVKAASRLLSRLDPETDPCQDFYQFSCGSFLETGSVPDDSNQLSTLQEMQDDMLRATRRVLEQPLLSTDSGSVRKVKMLYTSCMSSQLEDSHYEDLHDLPLFFFFDEDRVGPWPLLQGEEWSEDQVSLEHLIAILAAYQVHSFVDVYVTPDERNASQYTIQFFKGEPLMDKEWFDVSQNDTQAKHRRYLRAYRNLMEETILLLSGGRRDLLSEVDDLIEFETQFAKISANYCTEADLLPELGQQPAEFNRSAAGDEDLFYLSDTSVEHRFNLTDLENQFPALNWTSVVETLLYSVGLNDDQRSNLNVNDIPVSLQCRDFLPELLALINSTSRRTVTNYLVWRFIFKNMPLITTRFQRMWNHFKLSIPNLGEERIYLSRWKQCVSLVNDGFGLVAAHMYVTQLAPNWSNSWILGLIDELKDVFGRSIASQPWIEDDMKSRLLEKLEGMGAKIGYPDKILNITQLDMDFEELDIDDGHILFNVMRLRKHEVLREIQKVFQPPPKEKEWLVQPLVVNAFHNPSTNEIIFPLGILREPFYNLDLPRYMLYGNLGVVIGHEIVHGFDVNESIGETLGRRYDRTGNMTQWWSDALMKEFRARADCFIQQYGTFNIETLDRKVDGNRTVGENMCDNGGLSHAWHAYKNSKTVEPNEPDLPGVNYSRDQVFFITYGQIWCELLSGDGYEKYLKEAHSPGKYRANGVLQNSQIFADVFQCPAGSPMNPVNKCHLWS